MTTQPGLADYENWTLVGRVQSEVDEIERILELEKDEIQRVEQRTLNQIRVSCARVMCSFYDVDLIGFLSASHSSTSSRHFRHFQSTFFHASPLSNLTNQKV